MHKHGVLGFGGIQLKGGVYVWSGFCGWQSGPHGTPLVTGGIVEWWKNLGRGMNVGMDHADERESHFILWLVCDYSCFDGLVKGGVCYV